VEPFREVSAVTTGGPRPTVPIHRKLGIKDHTNIDSLILQKRFSKQSLITSLLYQQVCFRLRKYSKNTCVNYRKEHYFCVI
jgi:hypothetical protein